MRKMKNIMAMMLALMMVMTSPLSVLAESEVPAEVVTEEAVVEEVQMEEDASVEDEAVEEEAPVEDEAAKEEAPAEDEAVKEEAPAEDEQVNLAPIVSTEDATVTASYSMFKVAEAAKLNTHRDGSMTAEITYTGSSFLKMYLGTAAEAETATEGIYEAVQVSEEEYTYVIPVEALDTAFDAAVLSSKGNWKDNTLTVSLVKEPEIVKTEDATVTASYSMFKVAEAAKLNTYSDGSMTAEITYTGSSFLKMYLGTAAEAETATEGIYEAVQVSEEEYTYVIPVEALDTAFDAAVLSSKGNWKDNTLTVSLAKEPGTDEPGTDEPGTDNPDTAVIPKDGKYTIDVTSSSSMFKVVNCVLTVKNQAMTAVVTLSGTGYDKLFVGTAEEAANAAEGDMVSYVEDKDGMYTYKIPVESLDKEIAIAAHSIKNDTWYDRALTFESSTLKKVSGNNNGSNNKPGTSKPETSKPEAGVTDDEEIKDMIENTTKGEVKNGTYNPSFGYKGGTGRTTLSCNKVVVLNGKATATIVFSSPNYTYMKVNGVKYYNVNKGGNSTFVIPVKLNGATTVYAETTAMSEAYEIQYVLYVYVDGTNVSYIKPAAHADEEEKKAEEETTEETEEAAEEENGWGAFDSEQTVETTGAVEESAEAEAGASSSVNPVIPIVIAVVAIGAVGAIVVTKKKSR